MVLGHPAKVKNKLQSKLFWHQGTPLDASLLRDVLEKVGFRRQH